MEQQQETSEMQVQHQQEDIQRDEERMLTVDDILEFYAGRH
ncbi:MULTISPECIES: hypothetical protein [Paenibacillus]|uniref:Uncharacterized protein n=1 Tax=Paenibacillus vini TaxID=1476024 RepID=A0ABQ4M8C7_9BACL|nr:MULTISPECIES: hypothetical protein [Paenibacillus]MDN4066817.1 hypothetical protein [Paenibacillus vini]GIP52193.1 hypothetical protein J42TS3_12280 [Paenibacillus vini]